jgi:transcription initiation factor TFIIIB Brf1 subunit/transcription initiation factor TFIIB
MQCPNCGSENGEGIEVDTGVGIQVGPWECHDCGWSEADEFDDWGLEWDDLDDPAIIE